jgi:hypothetical protein
MQSIVRQQQLLLHPLILLLLACLTPCPYHHGGMGRGAGSGAGNGVGSGRQQSLLKWRGAPALKANANGNGMDADGEGPKTKNRKIDVNDTFYAIVTSNSAESPSLLSCLLSALVGCRVASCPSSPQLIVAPVQRRLHLSTSCCTPTSHLAPLLLWCGRLSSAPAGCCVTSCHGVACHPPAPPPLNAPLPLIVPLSCHLSGWLLRCLSGYCSQVQQEGKLLQVNWQSCGQAHQ